MPKHNYRPVVTSSGIVGRAAIALVAFLTVSASFPAPGLAVTFNFDDPTPVPFEDSVAFQQNVTATARRSTTGPSSPPNSYVLAGTASSTSREYAYMNVFTTNIYVTFDTRLHYRVFPTNSLSRFVAIDLTFSDGRVLRESPLTDDKGVRLNGNFQPARLKTGTYNDVFADLGDQFYGTRITQIRVAFDSTGGTGPFEARFDDISIQDAGFVQIEGDKVDQNENPFTDDHAKIDPNGGGSTCGPDITTQESVCGGDVPHYVARARAYSKGYAKMQASIPSGYDVLVSVCSDAPGVFEGRFGCRDHPQASYCRPKQTSSKTRINLWLPPSIEFMDVRWKYVPDAVAAGFPPCDKAGAYPRIVDAASINAGPYLGDEDKDGSVTATDGVMVLRCGAGLRSCSAARSDVDCDGEYTATDATDVFRLARGELIHIGNECDRDHDGLLDDWEQFGYDADGDGKVDVPLNQFPYLASSAHQDVFVECDHMQAPDHTHAMLPEAVSRAVVVFANAPITNIDSTRGIALHIDTGQMGGGNAIAHMDVLQPDVCDTLHDLRQHNMDPLRRAIFHYCVFVHTDNVDPKKRSGGQNCDDDSSEFYISQGELRNSDRSPQNQAAGFVHELGHDFGLRHGGAERANRKPNYLSVMNYFFAYGLLFNGQDTLIDYSRFETLPLDESHLDEVAGLHAVGGDGVLTGYGTKWFDRVHFDNNGQPIEQNQFNVLTNIDWNGFNGNAERDVDVDLNREDGERTLTAWNDWQHIRLDEGTIGAVGAVASNWAAFDAPVDNPCDLPLPIR